MRGNHDVVRQPNDLPGHCAAHLTPASASAPSNFQASFSCIAPDPNPQNSNLPIVATTAAFQVWTCRRSITRALADLHFHPERVTGAPITCTANVWELLLRPIGTPPYKHGVAGAPALQSLRRLCSSLLQRRPTVVMQVIASIVLHTILSSLAWACKAYYHGTYLWCGSTHRLKTLTACLMHCGHTTIYKILLTSCMSLCYGIPITTADYLRQGSSYLLGHYFTLVGIYVWRILLIRSTLSPRLCFEGATAKVIKMESSKYVTFKEISSQKGAM